MDGTKGIDDFPGGTDDPGQQGQAYRQTNQGAYRTGQEAVTHVFDGNGALGVAQSLHAADGHPLLLHHAGHGGQTHQSRHQEENKGEYAGQVAHAVGVHGVADKAHVGVPVQQVPLTVVQIVQIPLGLLHLLLGVGDLSLSLRLAVQILLIAVGVLGLAVVQLLFGVSQFSQSVSTLLLQGLLAVLELDEAVLVLLLAVLPIL